MKRKLDALDALFTDHRQAVAALDAQILADEKCRIAARIREIARKNSGFPGLAITQMLAFADELEGK